MDVRRFYWRARACAVRTAVLPIHIVVHERLTETSRIEVKVGPKPDLEGFRRWLSNSTYRQVTGTLGCCRMTAWRMRSGTLMAGRLAEWAAVWATRCGGSAVEEVDAAGPPGPTAMTGASQDGAP